MSRRTFLLSSASGALVVGCALGPTGSAVSSHYRRHGELRPNAWIRILPDSTVIFTLDRVEMGQGTTTSQAQLVCEELEIDPRKLTIEAADADRSYDNLDKQLGIQITGGSTSTRTSWQPLREAGATTRELLRRGAAAKWQVPLAECVAQGGAIHHRPSGRTAGYGELIHEASQQTVSDVRLKDPRDWRYIGKSVARLDARPKVDGSGVYGIDVTLPGLVTAVIVRPPVRGATLARLDATAARARRGVIDVVTLPQGVAVVATGYWEARTGADRLQIEWHDGPGGAIDSRELMRSYERMTAERGPKTVRDQGDAYAATGARDGRVILEAMYHAPYLAHAPMEPQNATAWVRDGKCELWAPTQAPGVVRFRVADALGFEQDRVTVHTTLLGGGFGRRLFADFAVEAACLAQRLGKPVKVIWSREDDQENDWYRPMAVSRMRGAVERGAITGWLHRLVTQSVLFSEGGDFVGAMVPNGAPRALRRLLEHSAPRIFLRATLPDQTSIEGAADLPYAIPHLRVELTTADPGVPSGSWRAVGHSHNAFVTESFLDELIHAAGLDPYRARRALLARHPRRLGVLDLAAQKAGWGTPLPAGVGRGIAVHESFESVCAQVIEASVERNRVIIHRIVAAIDCGLAVNPGLVAAQVESAVVFGLSAALKQQITFKRGRVQETNFQSYRALRMFECPPIETHIVPSTAEPTGVGEPGLPPVAAALCNAIFAATGKRIRSLPIEAVLEAT
ncbi:MAG TPA: xanthine dehydrogenase family protein molybdopterin-binding subunit [Kofleriaceae bacterium]|nr:xanthine dehydrogenase family protein molybdopterin-binding subunit [Kofleriaceae bacterium]